MDQSVNISSVKLSRLSSDGYCSFYITCTVNEGNIMIHLQSMSYDTHAFHLSPLHKATSIHMTEKGGGMHNFANKINLLIPEYLQDLIATLNCKFTGFIVIHIKNYILLYVLIKLRFKIISSYTKFWFVTIWLMRIYCDYML